MNSTEIHEGLPQKEIRDFLSLAMVKAFDAEAKNQKEILQYSTYDDPFEWAKDDADEQIKYLKKYKDIIATKQAVLLLIQQNGWKEHDVSDDVYNDTDYNQWMSFIGTDDELEDLHHKLYPQDDTRT